MDARLLRRYGALVLGIFLIDLVSKMVFRNFFGGVQTLIPGFLRIQVLRNRGGFQGWLSTTIGSHSEWVIFLMVGIVCLVFCYWGLRTSPLKTVRHSGFACMIGGALSNGFDRAMYGYVLDFLQIGPLGIFNFADLAVIGGAGLILRDIWRTKPEEP